MHVQNHVIVFDDTKCFNLKMNLLVYFMEGWFKYKMLLNMAYFSSHILTLDILVNQEWSNQTTHQTYLGSISYANVGAHTLPAVSWAPWVDPWTCYFSYIPTDASDPDLFLIWVKKKIKCYITLYCSPCFCSFNSVFFKQQLHCIISVI